MDAEVFDQLIRVLAKSIRVEDKETGASWEVSVADFQRYKGVIDRGFGRQYFLRLHKWRVNPKETCTVEAPMVTKENLCCQLRMIS